MGATWSRRAVVAAAVAGMVAASVAAEVVPAAAAVDAVEAPDFATEAYGNPWDFADAADAGGMHVLEDAGGTRTFRFSGLTSGGQLVITPRGATQLALVRSWGADALPLGRDGGAIPIDAGRYDHLSLRATWSGGSTLSSGVFFSTCLDDAASACQGMHPVAIQPGTHVYDWDLSGAGPFGSHPASWQPGDEVVKLLLQVNGPASSGPTLSIDWVRLHDGSSTAAALPPGTHTAFGDTYTVTARPHPVVLDPDLAGGQDYATTVRGDPWDMGQLSDVGFSANVTLDQGPGRVNGTTAPSGQWNDPVIEPASSGWINARRWHRLSVRQGLDGAFSLDFAPGGGTHGRFVWQNPAIAGPTQLQESRPIVLGTGERSFAVDLHTTPASYLVEPDLAGQGRPLLGWGGPSSAWVMKPRWDPHEDEAPRAWWLDDVRLARNDIADPSFAITFRDDAWAPGTTADLFLVDGPGEAGGQQLNGAPVAVASGVNTFPLDATTLAEQGIFWVRLELTRDGTTSTAWSTGPVETSTPVEFVDVLPGSTFFPDVFWLVKEKIANGNSADVYGAPLPISRQAMAAFLYRLEHDGANPPPCATPPFPDVPTTNPFCGHIAWLATSGVTTGNADGTYRPAAPITRQAMAAFLYRLAHGGTDAPACAAAPFVDVPISNPFCGAIAWMAATGITTGTGGGTYSPSVAVSRQAMAAFLHRYAGVVP